VSRAIGKRECIVDLRQRLSHNHFIVLQPIRPPSIEERLLVREGPGKLPVLQMRWRQLLFLHWAWNVQEIQATLPRGLYVDTFAGKAWLAIVPFFMEAVHPTGLPCLPWLSNFLELNVRTYVHDGAGLPGVWFYSLLCNQPIAVELARRCYHLNYIHARMQARVDQNQTCNYRVWRQGFEEAFFRYGPSGKPAVAQTGSLEFFLVERYVLFSAARRGRLFAGRVHHFPYRLCPGSLEQWSFVPAAADGFADPGRPADHVMVAEHLDVEAWPLRNHFPAARR
jgi:uncharacterized protein